MRTQSIGSLLLAVILGVSQFCMAANAQNYPQQQYSQGQPYSDPNAAAAFSQQPYQQQAAPQGGYAQQGYSQQPYNAQQQQYPPAQQQYPQQQYSQQQQYASSQQQYPNQQYGSQQGYPSQSQYPQQQYQQGQMQQPQGSEPTFYGYATDGQGNPQGQQGQYGGYASNPAAAQASNLNEYLNQSDQQGQQNPSEHAQRSEGGGKGAALLSAGKALLGVGGTVATGYFLSKAAQKQAQNGGVPIMPNGYGYGMPYGGGYGYGAPYGGYGGYGMPMGGINPMGTSVMTGLNSLLGR